MKLYTKSTLLKPASVIGMLFVGIWLGLSPTIGLPGPMDPQEPVSTKKTAIDPKSINAGISACATCHSGADQRGAELFVTNYKSNEFVRLNESYIWLEKDAHSLAFKALSTPLAKRMSSILDYDVTKSNRCLVCHAVDLHPTAPLEEKAFFVNQGVNCTGCHGLKETWQSQHYKEASDGKIIAWRTATPAIKKEAGMNDLRNPVVKSKLCVSCHIGDPDQQKLITHEMYAAGHPPLPPFEPLTYFEGQPRHWGYPSELPYFKTVPSEKTWAYYRFHPSEREDYSARHLASSAIASLRAEIRQLEVNAENAIKPDGDEIDYARFDCYACHHELVSPSTRQIRGYPSGRPGRASLRQGIGVLALVVAEHAEGIPNSDLKAKASGLSAKWTAVLKATVSKPNGQAKRIYEASKELVAWCDGFLKVLEDCSEPLYSPEQTDRLIKMIAIALDRPIADPDLAYGMVWAYTALCRSTKIPLPEDKLKSLGETIPLALRSAPFSRSEEGKQVPFPARYAERMKSVTQFDSEKFLDRLHRLLENR